MPITEEQARALIVALQGISLNLKELEKAVKELTEKMKEK